MFESFPELAELKAISFYVLISAMRPLGFLTTFGLFSFTLRRAAMVRIAIALALGAPIAVVSQQTLFEIFQSSPFTDRLFLTGKEMVLGLALGFIASVPFYGFKFAGSLVDNFRGESSNGLTVENNETTTTLALLFYLTVLLTFVMADGLWHVMRSFYITYTVWPLDAILPPLAPDAYRLLIEQIKLIFRTMVVVGLPLLVLVFLAELFFMIGSQLARRFGLNALSFIVKNLVLVFMLPGYLVVVVAIAEDVLDDVFVFNRILESAFQ